MNCFASNQTPASTSPRDSSPAAASPKRRSAGDGTSHHPTSDGLLEARVQTSALVVVAKLLRLNASIVWPQGYIGAPSFYPCGEPQTQLEPQPPPPPTPPEASSSPSSSSPLYSSSSSSSSSPSPSSSSSSSTLSSCSSSSSSFSSQSMLSSHNQRHADETTLRIGERLPRIHRQTVISIFLIPFLQPNPHQLWNSLRLIVSKLFRRNY